MGNRSPPFGRARQCDILDTSEPSFKLHYVTSVRSSGYDLERLSLRMLIWVCRNAWAFLIHVLKEVIFDPDSVKIAVILSYDFTVEGSGMCLPQLGISIPSSD